MHRGSSDQTDIGDQSGLASVTDGLGSVYGSFGDYQKALDRYQEARAIRRKLGDAESEAMTVPAILVGRTASSASMKKH